MSTAPPSDGPGQNPILDTLEQVLEHRLTKALLVGLVIISLLPLDAPVERSLRPVFLGVFGVELVVRFLIYRLRRRGESVVAAVFAFTDVLAFVSFLPVEHVIGEDKVFALRVLRLTRLLMLLRFAKELALDIYTIMTRREQLQQFALVTAAVAVLAFVAAVIIATLDIPYDNVQNPHFLDDLWWSFRQLEDTGNIVTTVRADPIIFVISLVLTITGVFIISFIIGIGSNVVDQVVASERRRPLTYHGHTVVTGPVHQNEVLIGEFVRIYAKNRQIPSPEKLLTWVRHMSPVQTAKPFPRVALLSHKDSSPAYLWEPLMRWVVYRQGDAAEPSSLDLVGAHRAKRAILLARNELRHEADAVSIATLAAFRAKNTDAQAFVEVTESATVPIVHQVGGAGTFALDMPRLLGMFLCQHIITPGVERLYRNLLTSAGSEIYTHVFVDEAEKRALRDVAAAGTVRFEDLARAALSRHGVYLIGVILGDEEVSRRRYDNVPVDNLATWLNPYVVPADEPELARFDSEAGPGAARKVPRPHRHLRELYAARRGRPRRHHRYRRGHPARGAHRRPRARDDRGCVDAAAGGAAAGGARRRLGRARRARARAGALRPRRRDHAVSVGARRPAGAAGAPPRGPRPELRPARRAARARGARLSPRARREHHGLHP